MIREKLRTHFFSGEPWTLGTVTLVAFVFTGAVLLGWDLFEHRYLDHTSELYKHRMHMVRGISTGVLISVGIAFIAERKSRKHQKRLAVLQRELIRKERLAAVGELAGGVAHEIRNPLAGIDGAITMLAREIPADDAIGEVMAEIQHQIRRMEQLVDELLAYARPGNLQPEWVALHTLLKQAAETASQLPHLPRANLLLDFDPRVPEIYADVRDLLHAFENLVINAFQAISEGGTIEIRTRNDGDRVRVSVRDDGVGMSSDVEAKIFEPFFTTKARGTGLGLSLVRRAVENNGGEISVTSAPGAGTVFELVFPAKRDDDSHASDEAPPRSWSI